MPPAKVTDLELVRIIEGNQLIIKENHAVLRDVAAATLKNAEVQTRLADVILGLQQVVTLLITQVTTSIAQRSEDVPIATHNKTVAITLGIALFAILVAAGVIGLDLAGYGFGK